MSKVAIPFIDESDEQSTMRIYVDPAISDANITAIFNAVVAVTLGNAQKSILELAEDKDAGTTGKASNPFAQREIKWLVKATDNVTGKRVTATIPCADLAEKAAGTDNMDIGTGTAGETLVGLLNTHMKSDVGNAVTVSSIEFVGRNT